MSGITNGSASGTASGTRFGKLKAKIGTDDATAREGAWLTLDEGAGVRWKIRSAHTREVQRAQHEIAMQLSETSPTGTDFDTAIESDVRMVGALVTAWEGMTDDAGTPVSVSPEAVRDALAAFPEWRGRVLAFARNPKNHRLPSARTLSLIEGNSDAASAVA